MSLHWGTHGVGWEPEGGERRDWRDVGPGDPSPDAPRIMEV
jgi:hypothetical protein